MHVHQVEVGREYLQAHHLPRVRGWPPRKFQTALGSHGFPGCTVLQHVRIVRRDGFHFVGEREVWRCTRDDHNTACTWWRETVTLEVWARTLVRARA